MSKYLVNRNSKDLPIHEIITRGAYHLAEEMPWFAQLPKQEKQQVIATHMATAAIAGSQPTAKSEKIHNTFFILVHDKENQSAFVYAYNADTPHNFISNIVTMCQKAKKEGVGWLIFGGGEGMRNIVTRITKLNTAVGWGVRILRSKKDPNYYRFTVSLGVQNATN